jgi:hypothetical protein
LRYTTPCTLYETSCDQQQAAVLHRADLDAAPFPGTTADSIAEDDDDDADNDTTDAYNTQTQYTQQQQQQKSASQAAAAAAQSSKQLSPAAVAVATRVTVLREGASLLVNGFVWQYSDVLRSVSEAAEGKRDKAGGDGAAADDAEVSVTLLTVTLLLQSITVNSYIDAFNQ